MQDGPVLFCQHLKHRRKRFPNKVPKATARSPAVPAQVLTHGTNYPSASSAARTDSPSYGWAQEQAAFPLLTHLPVGRLFWNDFKLCSSYSVCTFTPLITCFTAHLLTGTKIVWDKQLRKQISVNRNQTHSHMRLATHCTIIKQSYSPLNLGFWKQGETHISSKPVRQNWKSTNLSH